jgi:ABC-2 type transport system permease protein
VPVNIYLGKLAGPEAYEALLQQVLWVVVLWGLGRLIWAQASKKITVYGG